MVGPFVGGPFGIANAIEQPRIFGNQVNFTPGEGTMRSDLVFGAMTHVSNRFLLTRGAANATRKFHRPKTRIQDTANEVFESFRKANPVAVVSYRNNLQPFPCTAQDEAHRFYKDLEQSVA
jgi:hypothetical protein